MNKSSKFTLQSHRWRRQQGAALVEYAFVVMFFLTLLFGIGGFGHALFTYHHINNAAREATRYAAVRGLSCNTDEVVPSCQASNSASGVAGPTTVADVQAYVRSVTPVSIDSSRLSITVCGVSATKCTPAITNDPTACSTAATANKQGCTVKVTVAYAYNFIFPLLPRATATTAPCARPGFCLSSTSEMVIVH